MYLFRSREFWQVVIPFTFYIGLFNSLSTLVNVMLAPYSFSETEAGIGGALLIVVGLVSHFALKKCDRPNAMFRLVQP